MSLIYEYETQFERDTDIILRECSVALSRLNNAYSYESAISDIDVITEEASEKKTSSFSAFVTKVIDSIKKMITDFCEMIENIFSKKERVTTSDYLNSNAGKTQLTKDMDEIQRKVDNEMLKGRKLVQAISKATKIPDREVADFVDGCSKFVKDNGKAVIATAGTVASIAIVNKHLKNKNNEIDNIKNDAKAADGDKEKENAIKKVVNSLSTVMSHYISLSSLYVKNTNSLK